MSLPFADPTQFMVPPPNFEVIQNQLTQINSVENLLPVISGLDPLQQAELIEQWYLQNDPNYGAEITDLINSENFWISDVQGFVNSVNNTIQTHFPNSSATGAATEWVVEGGKVTGTGAAIAAERISYSYSTALASSSSGTSLMAVLSMNLPTVAAAFAPLFGVGIGTLMYQAAPEFWEKISRALLPWCYHGTELIPAMGDATGLVYFPKKAVDAFGEIIKSGLDGGFTASASDISTDPYPFKFSELPNNFTISNFQDRSWRFYVPQSSSPVYGAFFYWFNLPPNAKHTGNVCLLMCSTKSFYYYQDYTGTNTNAGLVNYGGDHFYCSAWFWSLENGDQTIPVVQNIMANQVLSLFDTYQVEALAHAMLFGSSPSTIDGLYIWDGVKYPDVKPIEILGSVENNKLNKIEYIPIRVPTGEPGVSVPTDVSNLTGNEDPEDAVMPWVTPQPSPSTYPDGVEESPKPAPIPSINPNESNEQDPENDPSQELSPDELPEPSPNPPLPTDGGTSPSPQNPGSPPIAIADFGLIHVYNPTINEVRAFGRWLWTTFSGDIIETVAKLFNNPMDAVIGLHELYTSPNIAGTAEIKAGYLTSDVSSKYVGNRYSSFSCGTVVVPEYYQNYLDYSPYTKCFAYLPFIGIVPLLADDIVGNAVNITYSVDSYTGSCIAAINVARDGFSAVAYQFEGNCAVELPITSGYQSTIMAAVLGVAGTALTGNPHVGLSASNLGRASLGKNEVSHSGSFGASYGAMGAKVPYLIIKRPTQKSVVNYNEDYGFPAHKRVTVGSCSGYLRAREVHVISPTATDEEKKRIEEMLKEGVFVK